MGRMQGDVGRMGCLGGGCLFTKCTIYDDCSLLSCERYEYFSLLYWYLHRFACTRFLTNDVAHY